MTCFSPMFYQFLIVLQCCQVSILIVLFCCCMSEYWSDQISHSVVSDSLRPHESQHARPPCPSPTPGVHSDSRPSNQSIPSVQCSVKVRWCRPFNILCGICSSVLNLFLLFQQVQRERYLNLMLILDFSVFVFPSGCVCLCLSVCVCVCVSGGVCVWESIYYFATWRQDQNLSDFLSVFYYKFLGVVGVCMCMHVCMGVYVCICVMCVWESIY